MKFVFFFYRYGAHRDLHVSQHSFPTRRSSDLPGRRVAEDAGRLDDDVDPEVPPRERGRVLLRADANLAPVDEDGFALRLHVGGEAAVNGVVLEEVREGFGVGQVVDADDLDVLRVERRAEEDAPDATEPVDADSNAHGRAPCGDARPSITTARVDYTAAQRTRATVRTPIRPAAAARSDRAHSESVAPVVRTSSTSRTWRPATAGVARNAPRTFAKRSPAGRSLCGLVARRRASQRARTGTSSRRAMRSARRAA